MKKGLLTLYLLFFTATFFAQKTSKIETTDIANFWTAYDLLSTAKTNADSSQIIQQHYIDKATPSFRKFLKVRKFTAKEYVLVIQQYPKFWKAIRPLTLNIDHRKAEIQKVLDSLSLVLPGFKRPDVCFAIGCLRTGGTTTKDLILIGSEIAASDGTIDKSELNTWLKSVIGGTGDIVAMVAHEAVHTQQSGVPIFEIGLLMRYKKLNLLNMAITEGSCDFITMKLLNLNINTAIHHYGDAHWCELYKEFMENYKQRPFDYTSFLYNGNNSKNRPADLGYYIGYKITEGYYNNTKNKTKALKKILKRGKYKQVFKKSKLDLSNC